jgi:hypothetical protein
MRCFRLSSIVAAGCYVVYGAVASSAFGNDGLRTAMFRELTSDQPSAAVQPNSVAEEGPTQTVAAPEQPVIAAPQLSSPARTYVKSPSAAPRVRPASYYGGNSARQTMDQFPRRAAIRSNPQRAARRQPKPFETAEHEPTISPYINLDRDDDDSQDVPNYLTLVLPQLEQMQMNRVQQREIQQLRGQLQNMSPGAGLAPVNDVNRSAGMGSSARFMDTAQFYGGGR